MLAGPKFNRVSITTGKTNLINATDTTDNRLDTNDEGIREEDEF